MNTSLIIINNYVQLNNLRTTQSKQRSSFIGTIFYKVLPPRLQQLGIYFRVAAVHSVRNWWQFRKVASSKNNLLGMNVFVYLSPCVGVPRSYRTSRCLKCCQLESKKIEALLSHSPKSGRSS